MLWLRALVFVVIAPGTVAGLLPWLVHTAWFPASALALGGWRWLGLVPAAVGLLVLGQTVADFVRKGEGTPAPIDPPKHLITTGLHGWCRNSMYIGVLLVILGESIGYANPAVLAYGAVVWLMFHLFVLLYEEPKLASLFGSEFDAYKARVPRWIPRRPR